MQYIAKQQILIYLLGASVSDEPIDLLVAIFIEMWLMCLLHLC